MPAPSKLEIDDLTRTRKRVMFLSLGSAGHLGQFTVQLAEAAAASGAFDATMVVSRQSGLAERLEGLGDRLLVLNAFDRQHKLSLVTGFPAARRALLARAQAEQSDAVVILMPHIWTPLLVPTLRRLGVRYLSIVHDAAPHPGDPTAIVNRWLLRDARLADRVLTLSRAVADQLVHTRQVPPERIARLFHPDLRYRSGPPPQYQHGNPFRLLFFGRILAYKGLPLLIAAVEMLRAQAVEVQLGVAGAGDLGAVRSRLAALDAEVINRWIPDHEVGPLLLRYDAIAAPHIEASQSGVAALAFGRGIPVVGMPVGGLTEQIVHGQTGVLGRDVSAASLAEAIDRLITSPRLYHSICEHLCATADDRSMARFVSLIAGEIERLTGPAAGSSTRPIPGLQLD